MKKYCFILTIAITAVEAVYAQEMREISFYTAVPAKTAPVIDGVLDDACWKDAVAHTYYYEYVHINPNNPKRVDCPTECRLVYDQNGVYCGIRNWEDAPEKMARSVTKSNQGQGLCWNDCAEIYFDPDANGVGYYKFVVNANGCYDLMWRMDAANSQEGYRVPGVQTAAKVFNDRWEIELFVPWSSFHGRPAVNPGDVWTFNHCRFRFTHDCFFCTSSPGGSNYTPEKFGYLFFSDGTMPDADKICSLIAARLNDNWGIQIGDKTYVHGAKGITTMDETVAEYSERRRNEEKAYNAQCVTNMMLLGTDNYVGEKIDLPYAGTYDFSEPKEYDGYNGWYRHNRPKNGYKTPHLDWISKVADRPRVCFMTCYRGWFRECCEIADRFDLEAWYMPCAFGGSGVYEDAVSLGRPLDKYCQFESILQKNPDVFYVTGRLEWDRSVPARYRYEVLRRVADEGKGLVFAGDIPASVRKAAVNIAKGQRGAGQVKFGKGTIVWLCNLTPPKWSLSWGSKYETRMANHWNAIRTAQGHIPTASVEFPDGQKEDALSATSCFMPFRVNSVGADSARIRVRNDRNEIVSTRDVRLSKGVNDLSVDTADLPNGEYVLDVIPFASKKGDFVCSHCFTKESVLGAITIDGTNTSFVAEGTKRNAFIEFEKSYPGVVTAKWELCDMPYRQVRAKGTVGPINRGNRRAVLALLGAEPFPTLAGELSAKIYNAEGKIIGSARKLISFPNHRFPDYTLISWDGPAHNNFDDLYAPVTVEELGYRSGLSAAGETGAAHNFASVAQRAHVRIMNNGSNTFWRTFRGFNTPWSNVPEIDAMGKEITPYDPMVKTLLERYYDPFVKNQMKFGTCCWNLGDECSLTFGGGYGPKDRQPYCDFIAKRYGTVENYNKLHGTKITDFMDTPHRLAKEQLADEDWISWFDHRQFMEQMYADAFQLFHTIVKRNDPKARIGAEGSNGGDLELTVKNLEFWGPYRNLVDDELLREIAPNTLRGIWWGGYFNNNRDGFPLQQWEFVLTGTLNADLWFQGEPGSTQSYAGGDMTVAPYMAKMQTYLKPLRRGIAQQLIRTPFRKDGAGLWFSHPSKSIASNDDRFSAPGDTNAEYVRFCYRHGYDVSFVTPRRVEWLKNKKIVFLGGTIAMSDAECNALLQWVKNGGIVVSDFTPAVLDGFGAKREANPLAALFGDVTMKELKSIDTSAVVEFSKKIEFEGKTFDFALKGDQFSSMPGVDPFTWTAYGKGGAIRLNFTLSSAKISAGNDNFDKFMQTIFDMKDIRIAESVCGFSPIFRVRELNGMRLAGFKTTAKDLGKIVAVDFGKDGYIYEVDSGFVANGAKAEIAKLDSPFKVYSWFAEEQLPPPLDIEKDLTAGQSVTIATDKLRGNSVYRLMVRDSKGREIENREMIFAADGKPVKLQFPYSDIEGTYSVVLRDIATGLETVAVVYLK